MASILFCGHDKWPVVNAAVLLLLLYVYRVYTAAAQLIA